MLPFNFIYNKVKGVQVFFGIDCNQLFFSIRDKVCDDPESTFNTRR